MTADQIRLIALYLPQYHPIPENDVWWGKGFTEWTNVTRARPLFRVHYQPHLPADLGFYDLRLPEVREAQAQLAREHGLHGFCYYHYWFNGRRLLERPFDEVLSSGNPDFPFSLCWANETWSRRWLGEERDILIEQIYSADDDLEHSRWLARAFADPRYIRVNDRPLFLVYRPQHLPDPKRFIECLREECLRQNSVDPYLVGVDAHCLGTDCRSMGFDYTLRFAPQLGLLPEAFKDGASPRRLARNLRLGVGSAKCKIYDYQEACRLSAEFDAANDSPVIPCVFVSWDNSPRRGENGIVMTGSSPEAFGKVLEARLQQKSKNKDDPGLLFINAWNEWAEGNYLEPDQRTGHGYLKQIQRAVGKL